MNEITIHMRGGATRFGPGEEIGGCATWDVESLPRSVELRLFWYTTGRGDRDVLAIETAHFEAPGKRDARPFTFLAPDGPPSFSGRLVSLTWALELVVQPCGTARLDIVISPTGAELLLAGAGARTP